MDNGLRRKSGIITIIILSFILSVIYLIDMRTAHPYGTQSVRPTDIGVGGRATQKMYLQPVDNIFRWYFGSQSVTGSSTTGYLSGDPTDGAYIEYNIGSDTINIVNSTLQNNGADVGTISIDYLSANYIKQNAGTGTNNTFDNTSLGGFGTMSGNMAFIGTFTAGGNTISETEVSYLDGLTGNIQTQITANNEHALGTETTGDYIAAINVSGTSTSGNEGVIVNIESAGDIIVTQSPVIGGSSTVSISLSGSGTAKADVQEGGTITVSQASHLNFTDDDFDISVDGSGAEISIVSKTHQTIITGLVGGTTTAGIALSGSTTANGLQIADWSGTTTACIGFSNGNASNLIIEGKVFFDLGGLTPGQYYQLGANGSVTTNGTTTLGSVNQTVIFAIGTNTGIIKWHQPIGEY